MKKFTLILTLALAGGGGWYAYTHRASAQVKTVAPDRLVARAEKRDIDSSIEVSGDVTPAFQLEVKPEVGGKLKALHVEPGDIVKEGTVLVEIDDRDLLTEKEGVLTEIEGAKLSMEKTARNYERAKDLFERKLVSREVFDNLSSENQLAQNSLEKAERRLQLVEDKLRKTKVVAPMNGTVLDVPVIEGQVVIAAASVNSGTALMTIADLSRLLVVTHINQVDVARMGSSQQVKLHAESIRDAEMGAKISFIAQIASVKNSVKGFQVKALIEKPDVRLRPGMTVTLSIPIASAEDAVSVPIAAIFRGEGNKKVIYVRNGETTEKREVKIGVTNTDFAQVITGVEPGEEILLVEPDRAGRKKS
jgi:RND family efflux transporter MFP subunit